MGGVDKGLVPFRGTPMVAAVIARLAPQVGAIVVNANQNHDAYAEFGHRVVADAVGGFAGPLAGLHAGLAAASTPLRGDGALRFAVPAARPGRAARRGLEDARAQLAVARTFDQPHPVFALVRRDVQPHLEAFLASGGRKIDAWYATLARRRGRVRRRGRRVPQHQHARRARGRGRSVTHGDVSASARALARRPAPRGRDGGARQQRARDPLRRGRGGDPVPLLRAHRTAGPTSRSTPPSRRSTSARSASRCSSCCRASW